MRKSLEWLSQLLVSILIWLFVALITTIVTTLIILVRPFDPNQKIGHKIANLWGMAIVRANPLWRIKITGRSHIKKNKGYVLVSNHRSLADIVCLFCLGKEFKWIAKAGLFKVPLLGWAMSLLNYIALARGKHGSIKDTVEIARTYLKSDVSVLFFPEGTRSRNKELAPFKNGAFKLAIETQKPIVPIVISGTEQALEKGKIMMAAHVQGFVKVLPEIDTSGYRPDQFEALKERVWNLMNEELGKRQGV